MKSQRRKENYRICCFEDDGSYKEIIKYDLMPPVRKPGLLKSHRKFIENM